MPCLRRPEAHGGSRQAPLHELRRIGQSDGTVENLRNVPGQGDCAIHAGGIVSKMNKSQEKTLNPCVPFTVSEMQMILRACRSTVGKHAALACAMGVSDATLSNSINCHLLPETMWAHCLEATRATGCPLLIEMLARELDVTLPPGAATEQDEETGAAT